jgi:hypothetical protein
MIKEAKAGLSKELAVEGLTDAAKQQKIAAFKTQMEGIKAMAQRQYESDLEQERLQLRWASGETLSTSALSALKQEEERVWNTTLKSESEKASAPSPVPPFPPTLSTAPTSPSPSVGSLSPPQTTSRPVSVASDCLSTSPSPQQDQRPLPGSQHSPSRQSYNASPDATSLRHSRGSVTGMPLFEEPESESEVLLKPPRPGRTITKDQVLEAVQEDPYGPSEPYATRIPPGTHDSPSPSPSTMGAPPPQIPQIWKPTMTQEEDAVAEARHRRGLAPPGSAKPFGALGPDSPSANNRPSPPAFGSEGRTLSENEREQREAANQQWRSMDTARAGKEPPRSATMDYRSSASTASASAKAAAAAATQSPAPPVSPPVPNLSTKPSIASLHNLEKKDRPIENGTSSGSGLLSATRPTEPALKRYSYIFVSGFVSLIFGSVAERVILIPAPITPPVIMVNPTAYLQVPK